ncbi:MULTISPECIES: HEAT repeat domain-containing protein [unclassified Kribbella]|uniref:HEAT repeat domain-containing protein n=1 Tax=unclassified Kribbella TaxID=2644121 RepID=UPI0030184D94
MTEFVERLVLKSTFTSDDVDFVSMRRGWVLRQHRLPEGGAFVDGWLTLDGETEIHQVDDVPIGMRYLTVRGPGSTEVAHHIRKDCNLWSTTEALAELSTATTRDDLLPAIYAAALSATDQDAQVVADAFRTVANHPDAEVRQSVLIATAYFPHPALIDLVRELRNSDPAADIRHNAQHLLEALPTTH